MTIFFSFFFFFFLKGKKEHVESAKYRCGSARGLGASQTVLWA